MAIIKPPIQDKSEEVISTKSPLPWHKRLFWFIAIWAVSVVALAIMTYTLRLILTVST